MCLILGDILNDPIIADDKDITVSVYGSKDQYRSSKLSSMHLQIAEGHVLGQASISQKIKSDSKKVDMKTILNKQHRFQIFKTKAQ